MIYLLDTNVVSDATRPQPDARVSAWLEDCDAAQLQLSVLTLGELRYGALLHPDGPKRRRLLNWIEQVVEVDFPGRILPVDAPVISCWAEMRARLRRAGQLAGSDGLGL